ncbi:MAG: GntR family transcriptional regulator [Rhodospirillales bacterium]|nr:GntR family transcriptional regulator [Rhodospirillales bacterium]
MDRQDTQTPADPVPAYMRVQQDVLRRIRDGALVPGDRIPAERLLSEQLGVSRMTVRQGLEALVRSGVLVRAGTSGTRVAEARVPRLIDTSRSLSLSEVVARSGARPGSRLLSFASVRATADQATRLGLATGAALVTLRRLRTANDAPFCVETSVLPAARVPGLTASDLVENASLYALLADRFGIRTRTRRGEIEAAPIDREDAALLGLPPGTNVLLYRSVIFDDQGQPVEYMISVNHPRRVVFTTQQEVAP